jgi:hypothetical protein
MESYDGAMEDVFDLQDKITSSIVATIGSKVLRAEITRAQTKPTDTLSAYDLYLRALAGITPSRTRVRSTRLWSCSSVLLPLINCSHPPTASCPALIGFAYSPNFFANSGIAWYKWGQIAVPLSFINISENVAFKLFGTIGNQYVERFANYGIGNNNYWDWQIGLIASV